MAQQNNPRALAKKEKPIERLIIRKANVDLAQYPHLQKLDRNLALLEYAFAKMEPGVDYGTVPGIPKPFLKKPGAERLAQVFGLRIEFEDIDDSIPSEDFYRHKIISKAYAMNSETGEEVYMGMGIGTCSSRESKYKYRWLKAEEIPTQMKSGATTVIVKDGKEYNAIDIQAWIDIYGLGSAKFTSYGPRYRVENPDIADLDNTIAKMAAKRAKSDVVQTVTGADRIFQRSEELEDAVTAVQIEEEMINGGETPVKSTEASSASNGEPAKARKQEDTKTKTTEDAEFIKEARHLFNELGLEWGGEEYKKIFSRYPNCKRPSDLSSYQRRDLLEYLQNSLNKQAELL